MTDAEARLLLRGDRLGRHLVADLIAWNELAEILLLAVRGDDRREAGLVEDVERLPLIAEGLGVGLFLCRRRPQPAHRPRLEHRRRGDDRFTTRRLRGVRVEISRVAIPDRVAPVVDHRLVDRVRAGARRTGRRVRERVERLLEFFAHRGRSFA